MGILSQIFEKRDHPSNPSEALLYALSGGAQTYTGKSVHEDNALTYIPVFAAVRLLSEIVASLPLHLYRRLSRGKERAVDDPKYIMMHLKPNPEMTSMTYRETMMGHLLVWGNCYSEIEYNNAGRITALWPLLPGSMNMKRVNDEIVYLYQLPDGRIKVFPKMKILHIVGFSKNGLMGYSVINKGREAISMGMALEEYGSRFFGNGGKPPIALEHPGELSEKAQDRLRKAWSETHQGLSNAHRLAILEEGMQLKEYGISPEDAQALESKKFQVTEIARLFNIPPHMLKDLERSTFSNIEHSGLEFVIYTLTPWLTRIEQTYSTQLLSEQEQKELFFEHLVAGLLRGDIKSRYEAYSIGRNNGWLSANDICELENMNPLDSGGDVYLVPLNMQPISWLSSSAPLKEENQKNFTDGIEIRKKQSINGRNRIKKIYHRLFENAARRILNKETIAIRRNAKKHLTQRNLRSFNDWLDEFYKTMPDYIANNYNAVFDSFAEAIYSEASASIDLPQDQIQKSIRDNIDDYKRSYANRHVNSSLGELKNILKEDDPEIILENIEATLNRWEEARPMQIANNETVRGDGAIASWLFIGAGYSIIWRNSGQACPFCSELDGKVIGGGQKFVSDNTLLEAEGQSPMLIRTPRLHPPLHNGCNCYIDWS